MSWTVTRDCCTSGMCLDCQHLPVGEKVRLVQSSGLDHEMVERYMEGWAGFNPRKFEDGLVPQAELVSPFTQKGRAILLGDMATTLKLLLSQGSIGPSQPLTAALTQTKRTREHKTHVSVGQLEDMLAIVEQLMAANRR